MCDLCPNVSCCCYASSSSCCRPYSGRFQWLYQKCCGPKTKKTIVESFSSLPNQSLHSSSGNTSTILKEVESKKALEEAQNKKTLEEARLKTLKDFQVQVRQKRLLDKEQQNNLTFLSNISEQNEAQSPTSPLSQAKHPHSLKTSHFK